MIPRFDRIVEVVQTNCHITDARHARNMTLCTYLLEMRELYRWEHGVALTAPLSRADVGTWLTSREALWADFENAPYAPLPLDGSLVDPFDVETANRELVPSGVVYGAGIGRFGKPQFFLGVLERAEWRDGVRILVSRCEYARDLSPAPAAVRDGTIYVRLESLQRLLWERAEAWERKRADGALASALDAHGFADDPDAALESMAIAEAETLISRVPSATTWRIARRRCRHSSTATPTHHSISGFPDSTECAGHCSRCLRLLTKPGAAATAAVRCAAPSRRARTTGQSFASGCSRCTEAAVRKRRPRSKPWRRPTERRSRALAIRLIDALRSIALTHAMRHPIHGA